MVEQHTKLTADHPAPVRFAFLADLARTAPLSDWMNQFDPVAVNHGEKRQISQKARTPIWMALQQPL
jgi:hypothetical protein